MNRQDKIAGGIYFGFIILMTCLCLGWWTPYLTGIDISVALSASIGIGIGILINVLLLKQLVANLFTLNYYLLATSYVIYAIGLLGFFMGVPVFHVILGMTVGYYIGRKSQVAGINSYVFGQILIRGQHFAAVVLLAVCAVSAGIALRDPYTAANLEGMLGLNFAVTPIMIGSLVLLGGLTLLLLQYLIINNIARKAYQSRTTP